MEGYTLNKKLKVLNLFSGIGGNRKFWENVEVTAIEIDPKISKIYSEFYPDDIVINTDAHEYLLKNYNDFDFIWSSPPCQKNSKMIKSGRNHQTNYPDLRLYEEVILLKNNFNGMWVVENVVPYYAPLIPAKKFGRHLIWSNFEIKDFDVPKFKGFISKQNSDAKLQLQKWLGLYYSGNVYYGKNHCITQVLRNCVHPLLGLHVFNQMILANN